MKSISQVIASNGMTNDEYRNGKDLEGNIRDLMVELSLILPAETTETHNNLIYDSLYSVRASKQESSEFKYSDIF
jgi:hypothetical protein